MSARHFRWTSSIAAGLVAALVSNASYADTPVSENANRRFSQGVRYLTSQDPGRYEKAYREFKAAYADSPSWKILGNLGIVAHELERDGEAIDAFKAYLDRGGKELSANERKQFKEDLALVQAGFATVSVQTDPGGAWILDERLPETGEPIINRYGPTDGELKLRVRAGHHRVRAEINGVESDVWEFSAAPGEATAHEFSLRPQPPPPEAPAPVEPAPDVRVDSSPGNPGLRVASYVTLGLGAVGVGLGTYFLVDAFDKRSHADDVFERCSEMALDCPETAPLYGEAKDAEAAENDAFQRSRITYVAGGALLVTGVVLFFVSAPSGSGEAPRGQEATLVPWLSPQGLGVSGRF
jgi:hypothetical protein